MTGWRRSFPRFSHRATVIRSATAGAAAMAALLTGCGTLPGADGNAAGAGDQAPLTVMTWAPAGTKGTNMAGMPAMAEAYARWVNSEGGIAGHRLNVLTCNERNESVAAARCAQKAVAAHAVAVVGSYSRQGRSFMGPLEAAGIPYIGGYGVSSEEFDSPLSYPVNGGQAALLAGNGRQLAAECKRVSLVRPDTIQGDQMPPILNSGLATEGRSPAHDIRAPENATDYTGAAQSALDEVGADPAFYGSAEFGARAKGACVTATLGEHTDTFFDSFRRLQQDNPKVQMASVLGSVNQTLVDRTGGKSSPLEGALVTGWYPDARDRRWNPMREVITEHAFNDNRIDPADAGVQTTWIAYTVLRAMVEQVTKDGQDVTARSLQQALDRGDQAVDTGGLTPKLRWRYDDMLAVQSFPRIVNAMVTYQVVRDGRLVATHSGFANLASTLEKPRRDA
ncbi:ABC transporter substrate-binding protein [Streptomyces sp. NPDC053542]|uniref:ABC transporter substrate-binding protein n=1 Tax=Streptomyces sp. NPDC053542 TaxID=3365710 RepID=UPI0037D21A42